MQCTALTVYLSMPLCVGMKHREERVVGGEVKPTASMFGEEEEEDPQVLYDKVSPCHSHLLSTQPVT